MEEVKKVVGECKGESNQQPSIRNIEWKRVNTKIKKVKKQSKTLKRNI